jgi:hypothetical protein
VLDRLDALGEVLVVELVIGLNVDQVAALDDAAGQANCVPLPSSGMSGTAR